jgi:hypothetical protein
VQRRVHVLYVFVRGECICTRAFVLELELELVCVCVCMIDVRGDLREKDTCTLCICTRTCAKEGTCTLCICTRDLRGIVSGRACLSRDLLRLSLLFLCVPSNGKADYP